MLRQFGQFLRQKVFKWSKNLLLKPLTDKDILNESYQLVKKNPEFPALRVQNCLKLNSNLTLKRKQFCTSREKNPRNVFLTGRICLKYFCQCLSVGKPTNGKRATTLRILTLPPQQPQDGLHNNTKIVSGRVYINSRFQK